METSQTITLPVASRRSARPTTLLDLSLAELENWLREQGQQPYRARQIWDWLFKRFILDYAQMENLPRGLRERLAEELPITTFTTVDTLVSSRHDTMKILYHSVDGQYVETVLMLYRDRATVCVSCQVGCAVGCAFCATGLGGLNRNLTSGEMLYQVLDAARLAGERDRTVTNIVMMGMGEPFQNYDQTMTFLDRLNDERAMNLGARRMTVSTSGIVPAIDRFAGEPLQANLAVSLHAPNDELRSSLVPINKRWPVSDLLAAVDRYIAKTNRRVSFEYALMRGINDSPEIATELRDLLAGRLCHVNLIPLNPVDVLPYDRPDPAVTEAFAEVLRSRGISTTVRYSRGLDISAACGQLRAIHEAQQNMTPA